MEQPFPLYGPQNRWKTMQQILHNGSGNCSNVNKRILQRYCTVKHNHENKTAVTIVSTSFEQFFCPIRRTIHRIIES